MNPAALLALISDLYSQVVELRNENDELRAQLDSKQHEPGKVA